jgi:hypothetical protein
MIKKISIFLSFLLFPALVSAQDYVRYTGKTLSNADYLHGQLRPAIGVHNIQTLRANRQYPEKSDGFGWTYNHAPMLAYWNNTFYLQYLSNETGEHVPPGQVLLQTSKDGYQWTKPQVLFPPYDVPEGYSKNGKFPPAHHLKTVVHQRVGFFVSSGKRLLTMGFYGICLGEGDSPNDGNGIGRVVREIKADGGFGPIYFIRYNHGFNDKNTDYPFYKTSKDKGFIAACDELQDNPLYMMQWVEEADRDDPLIPLKKDYKAFAYYHLNDGRVVGLWKNGLTSVSPDNGLTWAEVRRAPGVVTGNAKTWGQKLPDGTFAMLYDPSEFRWPLAISLSGDGLNYTNLLLVHGDVTPLRYKGAEKSRGPQYVRGIQENNGTPPDSNLWVTYSMNKEDLWVSKIPVPVTDKALHHAGDTFDLLPQGKELDGWNIYSPLRAPVSIEKQSDGKRWLTLKDRDLSDYAKAEKVIPESQELDVSFAVKPMQNNKGNLQIEFLNGKGQACSRLIFDKDGMLRLKTNYKYANLLNYEAGKTYTFSIHLSVASRSLTLDINGKKTTRLFFAPVESIERIVFRTGGIPAIPTANTPYTSDADLPDAGEDEPLAEYAVAYLKTGAPTPQATLLKAGDFKFYADYFNAMEDENIAQAIPNAQAWEWMKDNIPLFECPQKNFEEMYYYRWWTLRKHIKETPIGYVMTEFLINRSYAGIYNMIACAIGHHVYESRWLLNKDYLNQYIHAWYRGNEGQPMHLLRKFSSWTADALFNKYKVDGDKEWLLDMFPDLEAEFAAWDDHLLPSGLYWQEDVRDGMEESIGGGRKKQYARPTINSYMYGNAEALAEIARLKGDKQSESAYKNKANAIKNLVQSLLWNTGSSFFETLRKPGEWAQAREAIGFIPWYFNLPDAGKGYEQAWKQVCDEHGFLAPYGLTTAERRHPEFRTHGCCRCEWDGAIWPFASAQTLTALANYMNSNPHPIISDSIYFRLLELYVESQHHRGRPYIGEYLDETTGYWLKGDQERSRYYNHSTFNDLIITGLVGLRPRADHIIEVNPLIPQDKWDWFCLDKVPYQGKILTIVWDKTGMKYNVGKGFSIFVDGKLSAHSKQLIELRVKS